MAFVRSLLEGVFFNSIYGAAAVGAVVYVIAVLLKRIWPKSPQPISFALLAGVVAFLTLPSVPRYRFQSELQSELQDRPWVRATNRAYWAEFSEPITLFNAPIGSMTFTSPSVTGQTFQQIVRRFGEPDQLSLIDANCADHTVWISQPDSSGVIRYATEKPEAMMPMQLDTFCAVDWSKEREAMRDALKQGRRDLMLDRGLF